MLPFFAIGDIKIYTFGITLILCAMIFIAFLRKLSHTLGMNFRFFSRNFLTFLVAIFIFGRVFYFLDHPEDWSYGLRYGLEVLFFSPSYHFSLIGSIFGFLIVLLWKIDSFGLKKEKYLDISVIAFLGAYTIGAIGGFISESIYGTPTYLPIGLSYNNPITTVPLGGDLIPLGLIYSFISFFIAFGIYALRRTSQIDGISASIGIVCWSVMILIGEFFNGERLSVSLIFGVLSWTQVGVSVLIVSSLFLLYRDILVGMQKKFFK